MMAGVIRTVAVVSVLASIIAKCKQPKACFGQSRPTEMTLAHVTNTLFQLQNRLAWLVTWEFPGTSDNCLPIMGPARPPGQPYPVFATCSWQVLVDTKSGDWFGFWGTD
jgi:hypothetical protein